MVEVPGAELPTRQKIFLLSSFAPYSSSYLLPAYPGLTCHSFSPGSDRSGVHGSGLSSEAVRKEESPLILLLFRLRMEIRGPLMAA